MFDWIINNFPLVSGIAVAFLSFLSSLINFIKESKSESKIIKKLKQYAEIRSMLADNENAIEDIDKLIVQLNQQLLHRENQKINISNIFAIIIVAMIGGGLSYFLASWAMKAIGILSVLIWILFGVVMFFTIGLSIAGWASRYNEPANKE